MVPRDSTRSRGTPRQNAPNQNAANPGRPSRTVPPRLRTPADGVLDALVAAAAVMIVAQDRPSSAARLALLVCARRSGLLVTPPRRDMLAELDQVLARCREGAAEQRRLMVGAMTPLVGGPWACLVLEAAEQFGLASGPMGPAGRASLRAMASALALRGPPAR